MAKKAFGNDYNTIPKVDILLMCGYLQMYYKKDNEQVFLNNFADRIAYFKFKNTDEGIANWDNTTIINAYMQFIYSTLEYYIMPIVNIGIELRDRVPNWSFGKNVISSIEACKSRYYTKTYGDLEVDNLSDAQKLVISALKDYGMNTVIKNLKEEILDEIVAQLNVRYSTTDVIRAINYLADHSQKNKAFFVEIRRKYFI